MLGFLSGQRDLTVNQAAFVYGGSNPSPSTSGLVSPLLTLTRPLLFQRVLSQESPGFNRGEESTSTKPPSGYRGLTHCEARYSPAA